MIKKYLILILIFITYNLFSNNNDLLNNLIIDYENYFSVGGIRPVSFGLNKYLHRQGTLLHTPNQDSNYAICSEGFFKVFDLKENKYYYTRCGEFIKIENIYLTFEGYKLCTNIEHNEVDLFLPENINEVIIINSKYIIFNKEKIIQGRILNYTLEMFPVNFFEIIKETKEIINNINSTNLLINEYIKKINLTLAEINDLKKNIKNERDDKLFQTFYPFYTKRISSLLKQIILIL